MYVYISKGVTDTKFCVGSAILLLCVGPDMHVGTKSATNRHVGDMLPTFPAKAHAPSPPKRGRNPGRQCTIVIVIVIVVIIIDIIIIVVSVILSFP